VFDNVEAVVGWRGGWLLPGSVDEGVASAPLAGIVFDTRDFEPAPTKGVVASIVVRAADGITGSTWSYAGVDGDVDVFPPLRPFFAPNVVLASRVVVDALAGDPPLLERARIGGLVEEWAFGGQDIGRGLRSSRFIGPLKLLAQHEVRFDLFHVD